MEYINGNKYKIEKSIYFEAFEELNANAKRKL